MRRRSRAGGEPTEAQRRKTVTRKSRIAGKAVHRRSSSVVREETKIARQAIVSWPAHRFSKQPCATRGKSDANVPTLEDRPRTLQVR